MNGNEPQKTHEPAAPSQSGPAAAAPTAPANAPAPPVSVDPHATDRPSVDVPPLQAPGRTEIEIKAADQQRQLVTPEQRRQLNEEALELARDQTRYHSRGRGRGLSR